MSTKGMVSETSTDTPPTADDHTIRSFEPFTVHFFATQTVQVSDLNAVVVKYGDEIEVTNSIHAFSQDRNGSSWLDLLDDLEAQMARYGRVRFARGPWPSGLPKVERGSPEEEEAIARAWHEVWKLPTEAERASRRAELRAKYGAPPAASRTIAFEPGDDR